MVSWTMSLPKSSSKSRNAAVVAALVVAARDQHAEALGQHVRVVDAEDGVLEVVLVAGEVELALVPILRVAVGLEHADAQPERVGVGVVGAAGLSRRRQLRLQERAATATASNGTRRLMRMSFLPLSHPAPPARRRLRGSTLSNAGASSSRRVPVAGRRACAATLRRGRRDSRPRPALYRGRRSLRLSYTRRFHEQITRYGHAVAALTTRGVGVDPVRDRGSRRGGDARERDGPRQHSAPHRRR